MNQNLQKYFLYILGKRDYTKGQLKKKALDKDYLEEEIEEALNWLIEKNFVNDLRYAENLTRSFQGRKGKFWIQQKLQQKFIPKDIINQVTDFQDKLPDEKIKEKVTRKYKVTNWQEIDQQTKQKILGFLQRNGFSNSFEILNAWINEEV